MIQKILVSISLLLFLTNPVYAAKRCCCLPQNPYICKQLKLPYFQSIQADGDLDLEIDGSSSCRSVTVSGRLESVQAIRMSVRGKMLYIGALARIHSCPRAKIRITMPQLNQFNYGGGFGKIHITESWPSYPVSLNIYGKPKVSIDGNIKLCKLMIGGNAELLLYWINSCDAYVRATDNAKICLAGRADTLEVDAFQSAWVNAKYVRARRVFIKSYNNSRVDVRAICALNALASQNSAIYYYQDPKFQAPYMQCAGSVVNMTHTCYPPCTLCDNACCKNSWH